MTGSDPKFIEIVILEVRSGSSLTKTCAKSFDEMSINSKSMVYMFMFDVIQRPTAIKMT